MILDPNDRSRHFLEQFNHCFDGVLRRFKVRFLPSEPLGRVYLTLSVQRPLSRRIKAGWVNVRLAIKEVEEFVFKESSKETGRVLSSGLRIYPFNGLLFFDFAPYSLNPSGIEDFRRSGFYIAGRSFSWKVEEFCEEGQERRRRD